MIIRNIAQQGAWFTTQGSRGSGPNAFAACAGRPLVPGRGPSGARAADAGSPGQPSCGAGGGGSGFVIGGSTSAAFTSSVVVHSAPAAASVFAPAATPLVAPSTGFGAASSPGLCPTIGPEIRAAARAPQSTAVTETLAAAAAALHSEGDIDHMPLPHVPEKAAAADLRYALPRALWPPAPVVVAARQEAPPPPAAVESQQQPPRQSAEDEATAGEVAVEVAVVGVAGSGKVTPQVGRPNTVSFVTRRVRARFAPVLNPVLNLADVGLYFLCIACRQ